LNRVTHWVIFICLFLLAAQGIRWQERHMTESELTGGLERPNLSCWLGRPPLHHPHSGMWSEAAPRLLALEGKDACQHTGSYFSHFCGQRKSPTWRYCTESKVSDFRAIVFLQGGNAINI
uniref:Uncharacterized protein n=1 Tax=Mus spicilegus TaxID=10103 RepID=A0A8C6H1R8_MUSSI